MIDSAVIDPTTLRVVGGSALIGILGGVLGTFAYLRRQALIGDVVAHASLLGVVGGFYVSFLTTGVAAKSLLVIAPAAILVGLFAAALMTAVRATTRIKEDAAMGVTLAIFFGGGMTALRMIQRADPPIPGRGGLDQYLFGMAAATTADDLVALATIAAVMGTLLLIIWHRLKWVTFDASAARVARVPVRLYECIQMALLITAIVVSIQVVGVVLMVSVLIAPAAAARQWTRSLGEMAIVAGIVGGIGAATGAGLGALSISGGGGLPTGPVIVLALTAIFIVARLTGRRTLAPVA